MTTVQQLLDEKGGAVWTVGPDATVYDAIREMAERDCGAVIVAEPGGTPIGLFSERDYARNVFLQGLASPTTPVRDVMTTDIIYTTPDNSVEECMAMMTDKRIRHLPVMDRDKLVGMISIGDLVRSKIEDQKFHIEQLERYIQSA